MLRTSLIIGACMLTTACIDTPATSDSTTESSPETSTETGFDCEPSCGELFCGDALAAIYRVTLVVPEEGLAIATLDQHLAGPRVDAGQLTFIANSSAVTGEEGIVNILVDAKPQPLRWYFKLENSAGDAESVHCPWTEDSNGVSFSLDEIVELNDSANCSSLVNERATPKVCENDI